MQPCQQPVKLTKPVRRQKIWSNRDRAARDRALRTWRDLAGVAAVS
jgi:hypothetical protein